MEAAVFRGGWASWVLTSEYLAPSVFHVWLPTDSSTSSLMWCSEDNVYTNTKIYGSPDWSFILFSVVSTSCLISPVLRCAVTITQHHEPGSNVWAAARTSCCLLSDFSYVLVIEEWSLLLHWALKGMLSMWVVGQSDRVVLLISWLERLFHVERPHQAVCLLHFQGCFLILTIVSCFWWLLALWFAWKYSCF